MSDISLKKATMINAIAKYSTVIMNIFFTAILSRILTPEDYGIISIIFVFTSFFSVICDIGLGSAIIQNKELTDDDVSSFFGISIILAILMALIFCIISVPISIIYNDAVYRPICYILSISIIFNTINMVPNALLMKEKKFVTVGIRMIIVNIVTGVITVILAKAGLKYYALVFQSVISAAATFLLNYNSTRPHVHLKYNRESMNKIKSYSGFQFGFNIVNYFARNLDNLLIGKFIGATSLAYYNKGYTLMLYPVSNLTFVITPVLHPILSDFQHDKKYIYNQYIKLVKILSLLGVFINVYCLAAGREIILIMFGSQWKSSIVCFKILSVSIVFQIIASSAGAIYLSLGNTKEMFRSGIIFTIVTIACIIMGVSTGDINKVALFVTISLILKFFIDYYFLINKCFKYSVIKFYKIFVPDIIILIVLYLVMYLASLFTINNIVISAAYKFVVCLAAYIILRTLTPGGSK